VRNHAFGEAEALGDAAEEAPDGETLGEFDQSKRIRPHPSLLLQRQPDRDRPPSVACGAHHRSGNHGVRQGGGILLAGWYWCGTV
jgi:hypothetical protein